MCSFTAHGIVCYKIFIKTGYIASWHICLVLFEIFVEAASSRFAKKKYMLNLENVLNIEYMLFWDNKISNKYKK